VVKDADKFVYSANSNATGGEAKFVPSDTTTLYDKLATGPEGSLWALVSEDAGSSAE
jgi:hypothetical protein